MRRWASLAVALVLAPQLAQAKHAGARRRAPAVAEAQGPADEAPPAPAPAPAPASPPAADTPGEPAAEPGVVPGHDPNSDSPPPSSWDLLGREDDKPSFAPPNRSLTEQMFRTLVALLGVVALLYALAKLVLPRFIRSAQNKSSSLEVLERLNLDGRNTLVVVGTREGGRFVLGCGESHVTLLERTPSGGAFVADDQGILRPQPGASEFGDHLAPPQKSSTKKGLSG